MTTTGYPAIRLRRWRRQMRLESMGWRSYPAYLRSSHWRAVKARYRASDEPQDCICGAEEVQLHHLTYERIGEERLSDLTPLCATCHAMIHELERRGEMGLDFEGLVNAERAEQRRQELEAKVVEWDDDIELVLASMGRLREAIKAVPRSERRVPRRLLWMLKSRLDTAEREMRKRAEMWWGAKPWPDDLSRLTAKQQREQTTDP